MNLELYVHLLQRLEDHGHQAFFVGGCVRDFYLKFPIDDIDIATSALPSVVIDIFNDCSLDTFAQQYGVVSLKKPLKCQITTFRRESDYINHRKPTIINFTSQLQEDVVRRDFTINALYMNRQYNIIDHVHGIKDCEHRILRCVGDAHQRLNEDALRILRALRFLVKYDLTLEESLELALLDLGYLANYLDENTLKNEEKRFKQAKFDTYQMKKIEYWCKKFNINTFLKTIDC